MRKASRWAIIASLAILTFSAEAQDRATTTQTVTLAVNAVYKLAVSGNPTLTITDATAGSGSMTSVSNSASTFSITQNQPTARLTVQLSAALPAGLSLSVAVPTGLGTTAGTVPIEDGAIHTVMNSLSRGASNGQTITYTFGATTAADPLTATAYTVTWTIAD